MIVRDIEISVDFDNGINYTPFYTVQNDIDTYEITFIFEQEITDLTLRLAFKLPSETVWISELTILDAETATIILPDVVLDEIGKVGCQLSVTDGTSDRLTLQESFYFIVNEDFSVNGTQI